MGGYGVLTTVLTMSMEFGAVMCFPAVMMSNFSFALPSHALSWTGIKFSRKSPAVASIKRHWPSDDLSDTEEKALVAESSRIFASAAASAFRTPPARATETSWVPLASGAVVTGTVLAGVVVTGAGSGLGVWTEEVDAGVSVTVLDAAELPAFPALVLPASVLPASVLAAPPKVKD